MQLTLKVCLGLFPEIQMTTNKEQVEREGWALSCQLTGTATHILPITFASSNFSLFEPSSSYQ